MLTAAPTSSTSVELTPDELTLMHNALTAFLADFGHHEYQLRRQIRDLLVKIPVQARD